MWKIFALLALLFVVGCEEAEPVEKMKSNNGWEVELCFEKDGYKIYRFRNGAAVDWRYYVVPMGQLVNQTVIHDDENDRKYYHTTPTVR
jgi:hypothetical protein